MRLRLIVALFPLALVAAGAGAPPPAEHNWPQWRGPAMNGIAPDSNPPLTWSETSNVDWKVPLPGRGSSTPIVWDDLILLQTAIPEGEELALKKELGEWQDGRAIFEGLSYVPASRRQQFVLLAYERSTGKLRWKRVLRVEQPHEGIHPTNTWASSSPVTDGQRIVSFFGSHGLYCLDMNGELLWELDLGDMETRRGWGEGASPALYDGAVVVNWDHEGQSFLAKFDAATGRQLWRRSRDEVSTWSTPLVLPVGDSVQIVTTGTRHVRGYAFETGEEIWRGPGLTFNSIPTPLAEAGRVYLTSGYRGNILLAVDLAKASGDIEESGALLWRYERNTPYVASPLLYRGTLYFVKHFRPILTALDARTGSKVFGPVRLKGLHNIYASPVAAGGRIYIAGRDGVTLVLEPGPELKIAAENRLDEGFDASPAVVGNELYLRGERHLYRILPDPADRR